MIGPDGEEVTELTPVIILDGAGGWFANPGAGKETEGVGYHLPFDPDPVPDPTAGAPCMAEHKYAGYLCDRGPLQDHTRHVATDGTYIVAVWAK